MTNNKTGFGWVPAIAAALLLLVSPQAIAHQDCETCEEQYEFDSDQCVSDALLCEAGCIVSGILGGPVAVTVCTGTCIWYFDWCAAQAQKDFNNCMRNCY